MLDRSVCFLRKLNVREMLVQLSTWMRCVQVGLDTKFWMIALIGRVSRYMCCWEIISVLNEKSRCVQVDMIVCSLVIMFCHDLTKFSFPLSMRAHGIAIIFGMLEVSKYVSQ